MSRTRHRAEHHNIALMRQAISRVAPDDVSDTILKSAMATTRWPHWEDFGAAFAFVGGALSDSARDVFGEELAATVCSNALDLLLKHGKWDPDSLPPPGPSTLPPNACKAFAFPPRDAVGSPVGRAEKSSMRRATQPYLELGPAVDPADDD